MTRSYADPGATRVVVVGAGILGASIAFHLSLRGASVTVLDAGEPGRAVTSASFAWLNAADKKPRHYFDLNRLSLEMWDRFARRLGRDVGLSWGGELRWAATPEGAAALIDRVQVHSSRGYPMRLIAASDVMELEPAVAPGAIEAAAHAELEGHVDAVRVVEACLERAEEHGARIHSHTAATGLRMSQRTSAAPTVEAVLVDGDAIACDVVVLAAGAHIPELAAQAEVAVPMNDGFGAVILTEPVAPVFENVAVVQTPNDLDSRTSIRQLADGRVMVHGLSRLVKGSVGRTEDEVAKVMDVAARFVSRLEGVEVTEVRRDGRPVPADGQPVLGFAEAAANLYLASTHSAITLAPLVGELTTIEIVDRMRVDLLESYRVERFT